MTFHFILFTITVKKRKYSGKELEQIVKQQKYQDEHQDRVSRLQNWNN
ncbi:YrzI family small protein [Halalkalibacter akibai]|nr:YrzI family small protein [Halalkalibacter akibai]